MVSVVRRTLHLHKRFPKAPHAKELIDRDIAATDRHIDELVYDLYSLTDNEIRLRRAQSSRIVEEEAAR